MAPMIKIIIAITTSGPPKSPNTNTAEFASSGLVTANIETARVSNKLTAIATLIDRGMLKFYNTEA